MGNRNYDKGASLENDVANRLANNGFATVRAAGSGTADRDSCDVMAINESKILIIECKTYNSVGSQVVTRSDHQQMMQMAGRVMKAGSPSPNARDVRDILVVRQDGHTAPRYIEPFPTEYKTTGEEDLFKDVYY